MKAVLVTFVPQLVMLAAEQVTYQLDQRPPTFFAPQADLMSDNIFAV